MSFFKPLNLYYIDETEKWLRLNPGRCVTTFQVSMLFGKAYSRAASVGTAANGFSKTGIYPLNKDVFADYEFIPVDENNIPLAPAQQDIVDPLSVNAPMEQFGADSPRRANFEDLPAPAPQGESDPPSLNLPLQQSDRVSSKRLNDVAALTTEPPSIPQKFDFHVQNISPGAKNIAQQLRLKSRKAQCSTELTSSPYKEALELAKIKVPKPKMRKLTTQQPSTSKKSDVDIEKWFCKICLKCAVEDMIQCLICKAWVHVDCACVAKTVKKFICPLCKT